MASMDFQELVRQAQEPEALERTVAYLTEHMRVFLRRQERLLICWPNRGPGSLGALMEQAARRAGGIPQYWGPDFRWKALLRQAFSSRTTAIAGPAFLILGLMKLARATATPLYVHKVLLEGTPGAQWILDGIQKGMDCSVWGCYCPEAGPVVAGFSCGKMAEIHLRTQEYSARIVGSDGKELSHGELGQVELTPVRKPERHFLAKERARLETGSCLCGNSEPRLRDMRLSGNDADPLYSLHEQLLSWSSVLDYRARRTDSGLELEAVTFPGEVLPEFPTCAKRLVRPWNPEKDMPFGLQTRWSVI